MPSLHSPSISRHRRSPSSSSDSYSDRRKKHHTDVIQRRRAHLSPSSHERRKRYDGVYYENAHADYQSSCKHEENISQGIEREASPGNGKMERTSKSHRHRSYDHKHNRSKDRRDHEYRSRQYKDRSESPRNRHRNSHQREHTRDLDRDQSPDRRRRRSLERPHSRSLSSRSESRSPSHSHSRPHQRKKRKVSPNQSASPPPRAAVRSGRPLPSQAESYKGTGDIASTTKPDVKEKEKPNYGTTGLLARETNAVSGTDIVLKYNEPPDARKPPASQDWRLYIFKHSSLLQTIILRTRTCWLIGRELAVADIPVEHPSCSKQHAVIQFRHRATVNEFGDKDAKVRPYLIDLESSNGTLLNGEKIEASRYFEVRNGDVVKFGFSEREFVIMLPPKDI